MHPDSNLESPPFNEDPILRLISKPNESVTKPILIALAFFATSIGALFLTSTGAALNFAKDRGEIGDLFGGILNPVIAALSAWLIFKTLKEQIAANNLQIAGLRIERQERLAEMESNRLKDKIEQESKLCKQVTAAIQQEINKLQYFKYDSSGANIMQVFTGVYAACHYSIDFKTDETEITWKKNEAHLDHLLSIMLLFNRSRLIFDGFTEQRDSYSTELTLLYALSIRRALMTIISRETIPKGINKHIEILIKEKDRFEAWSDPTIIPS